MNLTELIAELRRAQYALEDAVADRARYVAVETEARNRFDAAIGKLEDYTPMPAIVQPDYTSRKISLIKLVRTATQKYGEIESARLGHPAGANVFGCMGLKDAKDFVEAWITEQEKR